MAMQKIKQGDEVIVIAGKDKGTKGTVKRLVKDAAHRVTKVLVEGANMMKKHVKPNPNTNEEGGVVSQEALMDVSNVAVWNPLTKKADRIGIKTLEDGKKVRYFKSNGEVVDI